MEIQTALMVVPIVLFCFMSGVFALSLILKKNDIADVTWGIGFIVVCVVSFFFTSYPSARSYLLFLIVGIWGVRLAGYIWMRNAGRSEDFRYAAWRAAWGKWFLLRSYLQVFILQGALLFVISLPVIVGITSQTRVFTWIHWLGLLIWIKGLVCESIADMQKYQFKQNPKNAGKIMTTGIWAWSRHPNYFGEVLCWWGVWMVACFDLSVLWTIISPLTITVLILFVSGVPMLEKKHAKNKAYQSYASKTSIFIPWFPKKN